MAKKENRFEVIGITPLLDSAGNVVVTEVEQ